MTISLAAEPGFFLHSSSAYLAVASTDGYATVDGTTSFSCVVSNWAGFASSTYCGDTAGSGTVFNRDL